MNWTQDLISEKIMEVVTGLELHRMPTRKEIHNFFGDDKLTNKISKTLGYYGWANKLSLPIQDNDTRKGKVSEAYVAELLRLRGYQVEQMPQNYPFDLRINKCVKVDVKFSNLYKGKQGNFYSFALRKEIPTCDLYILVANRGENKDIYIIPSTSVQQKQISIGENTSIYSVYKDKYETIDSFLKMFSTIH